MMINKHILLAEDDPAIAEPLIYALERESWTVTWHAAAQPALTWLSEHACDFMILDVGLPDMNGFDLCRQIRLHDQTPLMFLTARHEEIERIVGIEIGADDYCAKPFSTRELIARIKAIWRRVEMTQTTQVPTDVDHNATAKDAERIEWGEWLYDPLTLTIHFCKKALTLTRYELRLLELLLRHPERVWSRRQMMQSAWEHPDYSLERTVDSHIKAIRQKLKQINPQLDPIKTHRSLGYSLSRTGL